MHKGIVTDPAVLNGKPVIKGTRIPVYIILDLIAEGYSHTDIVKFYPHISEQDIKNCVRFASKLCSTEEIVVPFGDMLDGQVSV